MARARRDLLRTTGCHGLLVFGFWFFCVLSALIFFIFRLFITFISVPPTPPPPPPPEEHRRTVSRNPVRSNRRDQCGESHFTSASCNRKSGRRKTFYSYLQSIHTQSLVFRPRRHDSTIGVLAVDVHCRSQCSRTLWRWS